MIRYSASDNVRQQPRDQHAKTSLWFPAVPLVAGLSVWAGVQEVRAAEEPFAAAAEEPFAAANIHFETNATDCDMGIQMFFDTEGATEGSVEDPNENVVYRFQTFAGMRDIGGLTESFLEGVEPQITELLNKLGCERSFDEPEVSLQDLLAAWPKGRYEFEGFGGGVEFEGAAILTHKIPAGPIITAPEEGAIVPHDLSLLIRWDTVTGPIIPGIGLGPVEIIGYHVVVEDASGFTLPGPLPRQFDADVRRDVTSLRVPAQFLLPNRVYDFEILATEKGGNQTISASFFCTLPRTAEDCED